MLLLELLGVLLERLRRPCGGRSWGVDEGVGVVVVDRRVEREREQGRGHEGRREGEHDLRRVLQRVRRARGDVRCSWAVEGEGEGVVL